MAIKCFNCGDDHHLDNCPQPKDMAKIFQERQVYKASLGPLGADCRYHLSSSSSKQQSEFCPGQISDKLRRALHLSPGDYPPYIRRMVIHGYPPGYRLLEKENYLTLFDDPVDEASLPLTNDGGPRRSLEVLYPGFNDRSHSRALDLKINSVTMTTIKSKSNTTSLDEELGSIFDYEFEECQLESGEQVVELRVQQKRTFTNNAREKCFSMDFPPGLVHLDREGQSTPGQTWEAIKTLLENKKKSNQ